MVGDLPVPMEDTDEEVVVDDDDEFLGPPVEVEVQFSLQRPLYEIRYLVEAKLAKKVSKKSFFLWNERVDEDSKLSDVCYNANNIVMVGFEIVALNNYRVTEALGGVSDYVDMKMRVASKIGIKSPPVWPYGANLIFKSTK